MAVRSSIATRHDRPSRAVPALARVTSPGDGRPDSQQRAVLCLIAEQKAIPIDQLAEFLDQCVADVARVVEELGRNGWVDSETFLTGESPWVWLRVPGARLSRTGFRAYRPLIGNLAHLRAINEARLRITQASPDGHWICERLLRRELRLERVDGKAVNIPDAAFHLDGECTAIEVELSSKASRRLRAIIDAHFSRYDSVLYFCTAATRRRMEKLGLDAEYVNLAVRELPTPNRYLREESRRTLILRRDGARNNRRRLPDRQELPLLTLLIDQTAVPMDQFARFLGSDLKDAERVADRLWQAGLIRRSHPFPNEPDWLWISLWGLEHSESGVREVRPRLATLPRLRALNEARQTLEERFPHARWVSARSLRRASGQRPGIPDALVIVDGKRFAVDVFIKPEGNFDVLYRKLEMRLAEYDGALWFSTAPRQATLRRLRKHPVSAKLKVLGIPGPPRRRPPEHPVASGNEPRTDRRIDSRSVASGALRAIARAAGVKRAPTVISARRRVARGRRLVLIETDLGRFRVSELPGGWLAREEIDRKAGDTARRREAYHPKGTTRYEVSDRVWSRIEHMYPQPVDSARWPAIARYSARASLSGVLYVLRHECSWSQVPREFGGKACRDRFRQWEALGAWDPIQTVLERELPDGRQLDWDRLRPKRHVP